MSHWDQVILCQEIPCCALKLILVSFNPQDEKICNCHVACIWSHCNWFKMEQSVIRKQNVIMIMMVILVFTGFGLATAWGQLCSANTQYYLMFIVQQVHIWGGSCTSKPVNCNRSQYLQIFRFLLLLSLGCVGDRGMAVNQVKRFQHLQEQRTQAFHELGIKLFSKKFFEYTIQLL